MSDPLRRGFTAHGAVKPRRALPRGGFLYLLSDPLGLNLRKIIARGVRTQIDAALLLHAACFLRLMQVQAGQAEG